MYYDVSPILRSLGIGVRRVRPAASSVIFKSSNQDATSFIKKNANPPGLAFCFRPYQNQN
ncbi:protein of unknown function (plasmid) [Cupriavidus taiwanensis]|uniref:Uncharacterized protein n=1 Tax=Cupriavidus taiwanensis TaxID=164546 RepID=A0A375IS82_9BURK|nr:hypothetical protein CBM2608_B30130 [Cupriavidus taiwanensis]SPK76075.1 protein of unknown function [Cupriavidus taiwanensis]